MPDPEFQSVHLDGTPRRDEFRAARRRLFSACGDRTLEGNPRPPAGRVAADVGTVLAPPGSNGAFWLEADETIHPLAVGVNGVGRLSDNSVVLADQHVSRRHCAVVVHRDGTCEVHDVASKNGTILNGKKISGPTRLKAGDQLLLCTCKLVFRSAAPETTDVESAAAPN